MSASTAADADQVIWHDLECGSYAADLGLWRSLADAHGDPILEVGAGTGRVALDLARRGHAVTALDLDPALIAALTQRAGESTVVAATADGRELSLAERFALIIAPMQVIQLLGGKAGRRRFLDGARRHLRSGGLLAAAITETFDIYELGESAAPPLPDIRELDGVVYSSQPTAVRAQGESIVLERRREVISADGRRAVSEDRIELDVLDASSLEAEAQDAGFETLARRRIPPTLDHVGSAVVICRA